MSLDRLSKISTIVIAVILSVSFIGLVYSKVLAPYGRSLYGDWKEQMRMRTLEKDREENAPLYNCVAKAEEADRARSATWGDGCTRDSANAGGGLLPDCYWENVEANKRVLEDDRKKCEQDFPRK